LILNIASNANRQSPVRIFYAEDHFSGHDRRFRPIQCGYEHGRKGANGFMKRRKTKNTAPSLFDALKWVLLWIGIALLCGAAVARLWGVSRALEFFGGYLIELSLSMDN